MIDLPQSLLEISVLLVGAVFLALLIRRGRLPLTVVLAVGGFVAAWLGGQLEIVGQLQGEAFEEVVVFLFLPILVFEAVLGTSSRDFLLNLGPIVALATAALAIAAALVGAALYVGLGVPLAAALLFGVFISATDPVAVVAVFREVGVPQRLLTLVEGESLLNDGVAIVGYQIFLAAALTGTISVLDGIADFLLVFFGGALVGLVIGGAAALVLPYLERLPAAALTLAVAYGGFVVAETTLGFSGVMATVAAGLVIGGLAHSRASQPVRDLLHEMWEALGYIANALLFLFIGLSIRPELIGENLPAIGVAIVAVLVARALAVVPIVSLLERIGHIPRVGQRNSAVLVWGGLRGGVALALALPEELPQREMFIAMAGGVVLATLILNATTIETLVRYLGLDRPSKAEQFLTAGATLLGVEASRNNLAELGFSDKIVDARLDLVEGQARDVLDSIDLSPGEVVEIPDTAGPAHRAPDLPAAIGRRTVAADGHTHAHARDRRRVGRAQQRTARSGCRTPRCTTMVCTALPARARRPAATVRCQPRRDRLHRGQRTAPGGPSRRHGARVVRASAQLRRGSNHEGQRAVRPLGDGSHPTPQPHRRRNRSPHHASAPGGSAHPRRGQRDAGGCHAHRTTVRRHRAAGNRTHSRRDAARPLRGAVLQPRVQRAVISCEWASTSPRSVSSLRMRNRISNQVNQRHRRPVRS